MSSWQVGLGLLPTLPFPYVQDPPYPVTLLLLVRYSPVSPLPLSRVWNNPEFEIQVNPCQVVVA